MIQTLTTSQAATLLMNDDNADWSYAGATALVEYLENIEEETGEPMEFDRVQIRCEFTEYDSAWEAFKAEAGEGVILVTGLDPDHAVAVDVSLALAWLESRTTVIAVDGDRVIVQQF